MKILIDVSLAQAAIASLVRQASIAHSLGLDKEECDSFCAASDLQHEVNIKLGYYNPLTNTQNVPGWNEIKPLERINTQENKKLGEITNEEANLQLAKQRLNFLIKELNNKE